MRIDSLRLKGVGPFEDTTIEFPEGENPDLADVYLLVGENGCGKTTALHSLASALLRGQPVDETSPIEDRFRRGPSGVVVHFASAAGSSSLGLLEVEGSVEEARRVGLTFGLMASSIVGTPSGSFVFLPHQRTDWEQWFKNLEGAAIGGVDWAAFAYSGTRRTTNVVITSVSAVEEGLSGDPLNFATSANTRRLVQWAANQRYRKLQAKEEGDVQVEAAASESLSRVERLVGEIIGGEFGFAFSTADVNVRVKVDGVLCDFNLVAEGVKSIVSWVGDLLMRLEQTRWRKPGPVLLRSFLLLLDEIDVHLHPAWQRKILPAVQRAFPNAQIIASTHSPFVVASLQDGAVIELVRNKEGNSTAKDPVLAPLDMSYSTTLRTLFGVKSDFPPEIEAEFHRFQEAGRELVKGNADAEREFESLAEKLSSRNEELAHMVRFEVNQMKHRRRATGP